MPDLGELVVQRRLSLQVLLVHASDDVVRGFLTVVVGVMAVTEQKLSSRRRVGADAPTTRLMAVVLPNQLICGSRDRAEDAQLCDVRTKSRPESVERARLVGRSGC